MRPPRFRVPPYRAEPAQAAERGGASEQPYADGLAVRREDAEDTMQDVLFGSLKHLANLKEPGELAAWLYTVTRNR
ncbi:MAG: sigma factor, partial [Terracidiphilus sp.]